MSLPYYLGLPMWGQQSWRGSFFAAQTHSSEFLQAYSQCFNTVEGNTSFYALPDAHKIALWREQLSERPGFKLVFKFPKTISHESQLQHCQTELNAFLSVAEQFGNNLGPLWLQLPAAFTPAALPQLQVFLSTLPKGFDCIVEVRHRQFFDRGDADQALLDLLHGLNMDKTCFDSRALFACEQDTDIVLEAKRKKPDLPVRPVATGRYPMARFMGQPDLEVNKTYLKPWVEQVARWIEAGKRPYFFLHTPDNFQVPELAYSFHAMLQQRLPELEDLASFPSVDRDQISLF